MLSQPLQTAETPTFHEALLQALPHPVVVVAPDNKITYANFAAQVFLSVSDNVLRRRKINELVTLASPLLELIAQVRQTHATVNEYAVDLGFLETASQHPVDVFAAPVAETEDYVLIMLQQRSMAQIIERQLTHRGGARSVSGLAAVLAHEIKNPLSGIRGAAQLLETSATPDDQPLAQLICRETDRICNLVDRMEIFGDERPIKLEAVNIHTVLNHVRQIAMNGFAKNIPILQNYDPSLPLVPGNNEKLIQVFLNLVKNAVEAVAEQQVPEGQIVLSTAFRPGLRISLPNSNERVSLPLEITVTDNGPGVPEDIRPYLFEPFVTTKARGSGLGLALVAKIIGDHGGIIECEVRGRQTIFRAMMPMYQPDKHTKET